MPPARAWSQPSARWRLNALAILLLSSCVQALDIAYCSSQNDASDGPVNNNYMSNGLCQTTCQDSYIFAIIQGSNCWCSDYVPNSQQDTSSCSDPCPGYPDERCGNVAQGLYAYFDVGSGNPSGTAGGSASSTRSPSPSVSTSVPITTTAGLPYPSGFPRSSGDFSSSDVFVLTGDVLSQTSAEPSTSSLSSSTVSEVETSTPLSPSSSATTTPTQVYTSVISVTGKVSTIVVTPTPQMTDSALGAGQQSNGGGSGGLSGGAVAGIVIGVAIVIGLVIGGLVFLWLRRKHRRDLDAVSEGASFVSPSHASKTNGGLPSRQVSQMSSAGLLTKPSRIKTGGLSSGATDDHRSAGAGTMTSDRNSTHMTVDQRLNPWAIYSTEEARASNVSLQDNQDYSRQLRVANPDP